MSSWTWRFFLAPCILRDMTDQAPKSLRQRIIELMLERRRAENTLHTRIHVTPALEAELTAEMLHESGPEDWGVMMCTSVKQRGLRASLPTLFGMQIAWDADEVKVTAGEAT